MLTLNRNSKIQEDLKQLRKKSVKQTITVCFNLGSHLIPFGPGVLSILSRVVLVPLKQTTTV